MKKSKKPIIALVALAALGAVSLQAQNAPTNRPAFSRPGGPAPSLTNQAPRSTNQTLRLTNQAFAWTNQPLHFTNQPPRLTNQVLLLKEGVRSNYAPIPPGGSREPDKDRRLNPNDRPNPNQPIVPGPSNEKGFPVNPPPNIPLNPPKPQKPPAAPPVPN